MISSLAWLERHEALMLVFEAPSRYKPFPVQPDEPWIVLRYLTETAAPGLGAVRGAVPVGRAGRRRRRVGATGN